MTKTTQRRRSSLVVMMQVQNMVHLSRCTSMRLWRSQHCQGGSCLAAAVSSSDKPYLVGFDRPLAWFSSLNSDEYLLFLYKKTSVTGKGQPGRVVRNQSPYHRHMKVRTFVVMVSVDHCTGESRQYSKKNNNQNTCINDTGNRKTKNTAKLMDNLLVNG